MAHRTAMSRDEESAFAPLRMPSLAACLRKPARTSLAQTFALFANSAALFSFVGPGFSPARFESDPLAAPPRVALFARRLAATAPFLSYGVILRKPVSG